MSMLLVLRIILGASFVACATLYSNGAVAADVTAFVRVNVVPMDRERVITQQTVIVRNGLISEIGKGLAIPEGAAVIDGHGTAWLVPGLADMHVHADSREELAVMLANGITTALDMGEASNAFVGRTRAAVAKGDIPGPRTFAALAVDGSPRYGHLVVPNAEAAAWAIGLAKANGYEFIKVYNGLSPDVFAALAIQAKSAGIPIVGHGVESVRLEQQVSAGQVMIAHLEEFLYSFMKVPPTDDPSAAPSESEIARAVDFAKRTAVVITADLATYQTIAGQWGRPDVVRGYLRNGDAHYVSPTNRISWHRSGYQKRQGSLAARAQFLGHFVKALADADVPLIAGTDAPSIPGLAVGYALHEDLAALERAGLNRYQVLRTATSQPGAFIKRVRPTETPFGTVTIGSRADLLLVASNPLENLGALQKPLGVMAAGHWHNANGIQKLLDEVKATYQAGTP